MIPDEWTPSEETKDRLFGLASKGVLLTITIWALFPIYWMVFNSFRTRFEIVGGDPSFTETSFHYQNYIDMWSRVDLLGYFLNSLVIASTTTAIALFIACLGGYAFSRYRFPGRQYVGASLIGTQLIPGILILLPMFMLFRAIHDTVGIQLIHTYQGIIFVYTTFAVPFAIWMLRGFFDTIPPSLEEAARVDGCTRFQALFRVVLPLAAPGIAATGMFVFLVAFNEVLFASVMARGDVTPLSIGIQQFMQRDQNHWGEMMAASTVATLPILLIFVVFQKPIVKGLTEGGVKQ
ncbi:carbohydrate ABC transporter permease [Natrinema ejinorense]|uniref:ABC transporter permease n=1 Tax=Natrinema ejinorense TaxID=373386 RepID=A0A2A5QYT2_9EURY|nr:carbohydrate ABC transporter permease [Natrinema ejinorense]PCR91991.1 ABC transporter permease [Natrinema ejinorense]